MYRVSRYFGFYGKLKKIRERKSYCLSIFSWLSRLSHVKKSFVCELILLSVWWPNLKLKKKHILLLCKFQSKPGIFKKIGSSWFLLFNFRKNQTNRNWNTLLYNSISMEESWELYNWWTFDDSYVYLKQNIKKY